MGTLPGLKAFIAAVLGGIGSIPGAMLGGFIIGMIETMIKAYVSTTWAWMLLFFPAHYRAGCKTNRYFR